MCDKCHNTEVLRLDFIDYVAETRYKELEKGEALAMAERDVKAIEDDLNNNYFKYYIPGGVKNEKVD